METPLTPLEFARRARRLYPGREAVVDGASHVRAAVRAVRPLVCGAPAVGSPQGRPRAYIAPNTHAQLESFYAVPQLGAVLVPVNYRLTADDFAFIIGHSGAKVVCAAPEYLEMVDSIRDRLTLLQNPSVQEVAVVGMKSEKWGGSPHAFVVLRAGAAATEAELRAFTRDQLAHFKCPQAFHFVGELPKTATGKVQKLSCAGAGRASPRSDGGSGRSPGRRHGH